MRRSLTDRILAIFAAALLSSAALLVFSALLGSVYLYRIGVFGWEDEKILKMVQASAGDATVVYDRNQKVIGQFFEKHTQYLEYKELPRTFVDALIAIEDRNFFKHPGIDPTAIVRAVLENFKSGRRAQGASTITQQIARNFFLTNERSYKRKILEIALAIRLERLFSKTKLLEIYANQFFLGNGAYGIEAAAKRYFDKPAKSLSLSEAALLAGLYQSPSTYNPARYPERARARQRQVLIAMRNTGVISAEVYRKAVVEPVILVPYRSARLENAPYFLDFVEEEARKLLPQNAVITEGLRIYTTLDLVMEGMAQESIDAHAEVLDAQVLAKPTAKEGAGVEAALLSLDPTTGAILTMVGGRHYQESQFNRTTQALRSPGSAFKPIIFALALNRGWRWSDTILQTPIAIDGYRPRNFGGSFGELGATTLLRALYLSINTATVDLMLRLGVDQAQYYAEHLGVRSPLRNEAGLALGASEVSMFDLARVYSCFANGGMAIEPYAIEKITDRRGNVLFEKKQNAFTARRLMSAEEAYLVTAGLRSVLKYGTARRIAGLSDVAVGKTGTTNASVDNWFVGYTPKHVALVWVGNDEGVGLQGQASGGDLALPIWAQFMQGTLSLQSPGIFTIPETLVEAQIHPKFGHVDPNGVAAYFRRSALPDPDKNDFARLDQQGSFRDVFSR